MAEKRYSTACLDAVNEMETNVLDSAMIVKDAKSESMISNSTIETVWGKNE